VSSKSLNGTEYDSNKEVKRVSVFLPKKSSVATDTAPPWPHLEKNRSSVVWTLVSSKSLNGTEHLLPRV
jgi:hypothetical protein